MREKPALQDKHITPLLQELYGLHIVQIEFLDIGADINTSAYLLVAQESSSSYFLKIRRDTFEETSVLVPRFLHDQGIRGIIQPLKTKDNQFWVSLESGTCILYPFIKGCNGFETPLSDPQWVNFGAALKAIHTVSLPQELQARIPSETYSTRWREMVRGFQEMVGQVSFDDPLAAKMAAFMQIHGDEIRFLIERSGQLGSALRSQSLEQVLCHSDIHAGNLLLTKNEGLYIVDWDDPILAPKERDLMFIGAGVGGTWTNLREEELFYQGYEEVNINLTALTYYRYERIVQDIAAYCEQILLNFDGGDDRERGFQEFTNQFLPGEVVEIARKTDQKLKAG